MDIQTFMRRVLMGTLALSLGTVAACASLYTTPIAGGERCARCDRTVENRLVAGEIITEGTYVAYPFRTVRCMMTYLRDNDVPAERIFVADYITGKLVRVDRAHFVRVPIDEVSASAVYGVGEYEYVAFQSGTAAARVAAQHGTAPRDWTAIRQADATSLIASR